MFRHQNLHPPPLVPQQPVMRSKMCNFQERFLIWNPVSKKNLAQFYEFTTDDKTVSLSLIPDNCFDFMFRCGSNPQALILGPRSFQTEIILSPRTTYFFFKPYSLTGTRPMKVPLHKLFGETILFTDQFDDACIIADIANTPHFDTKITLLLQFAQKYLIHHNYSPSLVEYLELAICKAKGKIKVESLATVTGYSSRHCRDLFKSVHGFSLKQYADVLRFQNIVRMLSDTTHKDTADIVFENSLYDQSHLIHVLKKYTPYTPDHFRKQLIHHQSI